MGSDLIGRNQAADAVIGAASRHMGVDVVAICLEGSTRKPLAPRLEAQVIYVVSCAYAAALRGRGFQPRCVAGHSLGTYAALHMAGALDFESGLDLLTRAEDLMESRIAAGAQALGVILGLSRERVLTLIAEGPGVWLANDNCPGQYVVGGERTGVQRILERAVRSGAAKAKLLPGERAMHTPLLASVQQALAEHLSQVALHTPVCPVVDASTGERFTQSEEVRSYLSDFLVRPVCWTRAIEELQAAGQRRFLEVGPAAILTEMMPYIDRAIVASTASEQLAASEE
jgi:[acyl-carrier-protein] S-malonyltransferase